MIVKTEPRHFESAPVVTAYSDAADNMAAIREITQWARQHGMVRSVENFLNVKRDAEGRQLFYGACYRLDADDRRAAESDLAEIRQAREKMPVTTSSDRLLRD